MWMWRPDHNLMAPLHYAAESGNVSFADVLLEAGADVEGLEVASNILLFSYIILCYIKTKYNMS